MQCSKLKEIKGINKFNTNKVESMEVMFYFCNELEYLDLSNNTSNDTNMAGMFSHCTKLKNIKGINKFTAVKVNSTAEMFGSCKEIEYLDLSNFDNSNVNGM